MAKGFLCLKRQNPGLVEPFSGVTNQADSKDKRAEDSPLEEFVSSGALPGLGKSPPCNIDGDLSMR